MSARIVELDALRGFALLGIALGNVMWFCGTAVATPQARAALATAPLDDAVTFAVHVLVDGKFYALFSLLFGASFWLMVERARARGGAVGRLITRRLLALLAIGQAHALGLWFGDIISLYAVTAVPLVLVLRRSPRRLLTIAVLSLLAPIALTVLLVLVDAMAGASAGPPGHGPAALLPAFASGRPAQVLDANAVFLQERWALALRSGRLLRLFGMFVLGILLVRARPRPSPRMRTALVSVALAGNLALALLHDVPLRPATATTVLQQCVYSIAVPVGCLAYVALLWPRLGRGGPVIAALASAGRLSLTHYLTQSLVMAAIFYGCGLGLWGRTGAAAGVGIAAALVGLQVAVSGRWLRRFGTGPCERALRWLTHGRRPSVDASPTRP